MTQTLKVLGQIAPSATTETTVYVVPGGTSTAVSSVVICNRGGSATTFRLSVSVGGGVTTNKDYLYYDVTIGGNDTFIATVGLTLTASDVMRGYAGNGNLSFNLYGAENS